MAAPTILLAEDDVRLAALIVEYFEREGLRVVHEADGARVVDRVLSERPALVILDVMLPGESGLTICRRLRDRYAGPILMATARGDEIDQVVGLELGADDYVPKPASPRLLLARVRALLRRDSQPAVPAERVIAGDVVIDNGARVVTRAGERVDLTTAEYDLLWFLARNAGKVLSRDDILDAVRGVSYDGLDRSIDLRISRLRQKLGDDPKAPALLKTVRGAGYLFARPAG